MFAYFAPSGGSDLRKTLKSIDFITAEVGADCLLAKSDLSIGRANALAANDGTFTVPEGLKGKVIGIAGNENKKCKVRRVWTSSMTIQWSERGCLVFPVAGYSTVRFVLA